MGGRATTSIGTRSVTYRIQLSPHALKEYRKLDPSLRLPLQAAMDALQENPVSGAKIKRLKGRLHDYYRCRVGDYRILYVVDRTERLVRVDYIQHRKDVYLE